MNIRTIAALGKEQYIVDKFVALITLPYRYAIFYLRHIELIKNQAIVSRITNSND